jgi:hypothetical protein
VPDASRADSPPDSTVAALPRAGRPSPAGPRRRLRSALVGLLLGLALIFPAATMAPWSTDTAAAGRSCTGWTSRTTPPKNIRVFTPRTGKVAKVNFRRYVAVVMAREWPAYLPPATLEAGAIAVKQFAWYHSLAGNHRRGFVTRSGKCFDVLSTTRDQLYQPHKARIHSRHWRAIDRTWGISLRKGSKGKFFLTQYRYGAKVRCGRDADGRRLMERSAVSCARKGYAADQILATYYGPRLVAYRSDGSQIAGFGKGTGIAAAGPGQGASLPAADTGEPGPAEAAMAELRAERTRLPVSLQLALRPELGPTYGPLVAGDAPDGLTVDGPPLATGRLVTARG